MVLSEVLSAAEEYPEGADSLRLSLIALSGAGRSPSLKGRGGGVWVAQLHVCYTSPFLKGIQSWTCYLKPQWGLSFLIC